MPHQVCPRCKLSIRIQAPSMAMAHCPRCLARSGLISQLALENPANPSVGEPEEPDGGAQPLATRSTCQEMAA
jgi:hypothetical protein